MSELEKEDYKLDCGMCGAEIYIKPTIQKERVKAEKFKKELLLSIDRMRLNIVRQPLERIWNEVYGSKKSSDNKEKGK